MMYYLNAPLSYWLNQVHNLGAFDLLRHLPDNCIHCCITSPPYWGLRAYLPDDHPNKSFEMGSEPTLAEFIQAQVLLFREIRRVLRPDGVCFVNMGDSYASSVNGRSAADTKDAGGDDRTFRDKPFSTVGNGLKPKDLCGQPHRLVFALQDDGWYFRDEIIWHKTNPMPNSAKDRCTRSHEFVFMLTKSEHYWYDQTAIREPAQDWGERDRDNGKYTSGQPPIKNGKHHGLRGQYAKPGAELTRIKRSVWSIPTQPSTIDHFATFPEALITPMILAGCPDKVCSACGTPWMRQVETDLILAKTEGRRKKRNDSPKGLDQSDRRGGHVRGHTRVETVGWQPGCTCNAPTKPGIVFDPFMGVGTTAIVARKLGRQYIGSELSPIYAAIAHDRLRPPLSKRRYIKPDKPLKLPKPVVIGDTTLQQVTLIE